MFSFSFCLLFVYSLSLCEARKHGIEKSSSVPSKNVQLTVISEPETSSAAGEVAHVVDVEVELHMSAVEWRELSLDGIEMDKCRKVKKNRRTKIEISGQAVDLSDFSSSPNAFTITHQEWDSDCGKSIGTFSDISNDDELLCFLIVDSRGDDGIRAVLTLKRINCMLVAPSVTATVRNNAVPISAVPSRLLNTNGRSVEEPEVTGKSILEDVSVPASERISLKFYEKITLSTDSESKVQGLATFEASAGFGVDIQNFSIKKKLKWLFWKSKVYGNFDVVLWAETSTNLDISGSYTADTSKQLLRQSVPGVGWSIKIPFLGRVGIGGFAKLDFVADIAFEVGASLTTSSSFAKRERVSFDMIPKFKISASLLSKSNSGNSGMEVTNSYSSSASAAITGFAGLRPAAGLEINFGKVFKGEANLGVKIGLQASLTAKYPPFDPVNTAGLLVGVCSTCHSVQGVLSLKGKDLELEYSSGSTEKEITILEDVFDIALGTFCAAERACGMTRVFGNNFKSNQVLPHT